MFFRESGERSMWGKGKGLNGWNDGGVEHVAPP